MLRLARRRVGARRQRPLDAFEVAPVGGGVERAGARLQGHDATHFKGAVHGALQVAAHALALTPTPGVWRGECSRRATAVVGAALARFALQMLRRTRVPSSLPCSDGAWNFLLS